MTPPAGQDHGYKGNTNVCGKFLQQQNDMNWCMDLCGPISPPTPAVNKYFMLLVDDLTRMMWVFMLKTKDEALNVFKKFKERAEKESKQEIKGYRGIIQLRIHYNIMELCKGEIVRWWLWEGYIFKKLNDRSKLVIYLGKESGTKAFRLYDPVEGTQNTMGATGSGEQNEGNHEINSWSSSASGSTNGFNSLGSSSGSNTGSLNDMSDVRKLHAGHKVIDLKWVFKVKRDTYGKVVKHKARLVEKGYVQRYRVDYEEVFGPVTRMETVRLLLALAAKMSGRYITLM
ncbi:uncharacterized protein LOC141713973 [Apium graveolens]|uniref:uncharacterized protein LOC141713973 n=1 Tax=Apium graveolens TaxID=4045 RepID=UPI003D78D730